jgi:hypothetical protein
MATRETVRAPGRPHLAVFDATTLLAKGLKDQLLARKFPSPAGATWNAVRIAETLVERGIGRATP